MKNRGKKLVGDAFVTLVLKVFGATSGLLITLVLTRVLSPNDLGYFFVAQSTAIFFALIARFGMKQPVVREVSSALASGRVDLIPRVVSSAFIVVATGTAIVATILFSGGGVWVFSDIFKMDGATGSIGPWVLLVCALAFQVPLAESMRGIHRIGSAMLFDGPLANFLFLVALIIFLGVGAEALYADILSLYFLATLTSVVLGSALFVSRLQDRRLIPSGDALRSLVGQGFRVYIINVSTFITAQSGLWISAAYLSSTDAAVFGAVFRLTLVISLPLFVLNTIVQPVIVEYLTEGREQQLQHLVRRTTTVAASASAIPVVLALTIPELILRVCFGEGYAVGADVLRVLAISSLVSVAVGPCLNFLVLSGNAATGTRIVLISGAISIAICIACVETFGNVGVAMGVATGVIWQNLWARQSVSKLTHVATHTYFSLGEIENLLRDAKAALQAARSVR